MDQLPQIFQPLLPYLSYLWAIPVGIVSCYVGWRIRGVELRSSQLAHQEAVQTRELRLRTLQIEMDRRDLELEEKKTEEFRELNSLRKDVGELQPLRVSLKKYKTQLAEVNNEKLSMEREFAKERNSLTRKIEQNDHNLIAEQTFEDKFYSLQTKYKQMDAKRSLEIVSLKADMVELRKAAVISDNTQSNQSTSLQQLQTTIETLKGARAGQEAGYNAVNMQLKDSKAEVATLKDRLRVDTGKLVTKIAVMEESLKSVSTTKNALEKKTAQYNYAIRELAVEKKQTTKFREKFDALTASSQSQLSEYNRKTAHLSLKLDNTKEESYKEIAKLKARRRELESLSTINKNQQRSIERLESQLTEQRRRADGFQKLQTEHVTLQAELQKNSLKLKTVQTELKEKSDRVNKLSDQLQRSEFENKKINGIKAQLATKTIESGKLKKELTVQSKIKDLLDSRTKRLETEQDANKDLRQQLKLASDQLTTMDNLKVSYEELQSLKPELSQKNIRIEQLKTQLDEKESQLAIEVEKTIENQELSAEIDARQNRIVGLLAEIERLKSTNESLSKLKPELEEYKSEAQKQSEAHTQRAHKISDLEQQLLGQKQTISQLNRSIAEYKVKIDSANRNDKALAIAETSLTKQKEATHSQKAEIVTLNAELAKLNTLHDKLLRTEKSLATRNTELTASAEQFNNEKSRREKELAQHKFEIANAKTEKSQLYSKVAELQDDLTSSQKSIELAKVKFESECKELKIQNRKSLSLEKSKIDNLELELQKERESRSLESNERDKNNVALKALESKVTSLTQRLKEAGEEKSITENEIKEQSKTIIELREKIDARSIEITNLKKTNQSLKADTQATEKLLEQEQQLSLEKSISKSLETKIASLANELQLSSEKTRKLKSDAVKLQEEKANLAQKLSSEAAARQESVTALTKTQQQLETSIALKPKLNKEIEEKKSISEKLQNALRDVQSLKEKAVELSKSSDAQLTENLAIKARLIDSEKVVSKVQRENKSLQLEVEKVEVEKATLLKAEKIETRQLNDSLKKKIEEKNQRLLDSESHITELSNKLQSMSLIEADIAEQDEKVKNLRTELKEQQEKTTEAQKLLAKLRNQAESADDQSRKISALQDELRKSREISSKSRIYQDQIIKLNQVNKKFKILQASMQDRQADFNRLQRELDRLANVENLLKDKEKEIEQLRSVETQIKDRDSRISELNETIASFKTSVPESKNNDVDLNRLRGQVESLTRERDLGLDRVREMSESTKVLAEREKTIKQLKNEIADDRVNNRDLEALRQRIQQNETELQQKNETIEELKRMLQTSNKAKSQAQTKTKIVAKGAAVAKTRTEKSGRSDLHRSNTLFKATTQRDDLKKIHGIGPVMEKTLNDLGITSFQQIANFSEGDIDRVSKAIDTFPGRVERDDWIGGARKEHNEKYGKSPA